MAETMFIRLQDGGGESTWAAFDATGALASPIGRGSLEQARTALDGRRVAVLAPAVDVIAAQADLPAGSQARLRQIVPFSLEDSFADDIDQLAFAIGARAPSGRTPVAVVAKTQLEGWLERLRSAGIVPQAVYSEADGVPDVPATLVLLLEGKRVLGRRPGEPPFAFDDLPLRQIVSLVRGAGDAPPVDHVLVYSDAAGRAHYEQEIARLGDEFAAADVKLAVDGIFPHLAAAIAQRPGTNLLQGAYAPKSNMSALVKPWRLAAGLAAASLVLALVTQGAEYWSLRRTDDALTALVAETCGRVLGESRPSACQREVQQRLGATSAGGSGETFLSTLAAVAGSRDPEMRIDALSYRNRVMDLQLIAPSVPAIDEFARGLEETRRFDAEIESANQTAEGTEGRVRIAGANP